MKRIATSSQGLLKVLLVLAIALLLVPHGLAADCPSGCSCLTPENAKKLGYEDCSEKQVICSYDSTQRPMYCYRESVTLVQPTRTLVPVSVTTTTTTPLPSCPQGCECLTEDLARAKYGTYQPCSNAPCAQAVTGSAVVSAYCYRPAPTLYPACPSGCECMNEVQARARFGENAYTRCSAVSCGSESMTSAAAVVEKYCFQPAAATVISAGQCQAGCSCMSEAVAEEKGYPPCRGQRTPCGYDATQVQLFCSEVVPSAACTFDYQRNACTGTCQQGFTCSIIAQEKDATGAVKYAVCGCQPPSTECGYNANMNACTGTCKEGTCAVTGKTKDATGAEKPVCGCHTETCVFDYAGDACTGSCPAGSGVCQLNTIYRDAAGKTIYGECHCKGLPEQTPVTVKVTKTPEIQATCTCSAGSCIGNCPEGQTCWMAAITTDALGKVSCTECTCRETCRLTPANECTGSCPQGGDCERVVVKDEASGAEKVSCACGGAPAAAGTTPAEIQKAPSVDIITAIASFFRSLFGMK